MNTILVSILVECKTRLRIQRLYHASNVNSQHYAIHIHNAVLSSEFFIGLLYYCTQTDSGQTATRSSADRTAYDVRYRIDTGNRIK